MSETRERDIWDVIDMVVAEIPVAVDEKTDVVRQLRHLATDSKYKAPELMGEQWARLCDILNRAASVCEKYEIEIGWVEKTVAIVNGALRPELTE